MLYVIVWPRGRRKMGTDYSLMDIYIYIYIYTHTYIIGYSPRIPESPKPRIHESEIRESANGDILEKCFRSSPSLTSPANLASDR